MSFVDSLGKKFAVTVEVEPPSRVDFSFLKQAEHYKGFVDAVNVPDSPMGMRQMGSLAPCLVLKERFGLEPILQLCCRDRNQTALVGDLLGANLLGIENVLCLTGDYPSDKSSKTVFELDAVRMARLVKNMPKEFRGFGMRPGVAVNPNCRPLAPQLLNFERKMRFADFAQTQLVFDTAVLKDPVLLKYREKTLVGVMPLLGKKFARGFAKKVPGIRIPERVLSETVSVDRGFEYANQLVGEVKDLGYAGVHLIVFEFFERFPELLRGVL